MNPAEEPDSWVLMQRGAELTTKVINNERATDQQRLAAIAERKVIRAELQRRDEEIEASRLAAGDPEATERDRIRRELDDE